MNDVFFLFRTNCTDGSHCLPPGERSKDAPQADRQQWFGTAPHPRGPSRGCSGGLIADGKARNDTGRPASGGSHSASALQPALSAHSTRIGAHVFSLSLFSNRAPYYPRSGLPPSPTAGVCSLISSPSRLQLRAQDATCLLERALSVHNFPSARQ